MDWQLASEVVRNAALPVLGLIGSVLAWRQLRISQGRLGTEQMAKAVDMLDGSQRSTRIAGYRLLLEAQKNTIVRRLAIETFLTYLGGEEDVVVLKSLQAGKPSPLVDEAISAATQRLQGKGKDRDV
ncbi:MAG: hypothetical protein AAFO77_11095 [Pseudomonadota bacterium]